MTGSNEFPERSAPRRGRPPRNTDAIIEAAKQVFARLGYTATTIDDIALEARASTATLYKHFESKAKLFEAVIGLRAQEVKFGATIGDDPARSIPERIVKMLEGTAHVLLDPVAHGLTRAYLGELERAPELLPLYVNSGPGAAIKALSALVALGQEQGLFRTNIKPDMAANLALSVIERYTLLTALFFGPASLTKIPDCAVLAAEAYKVLCQTAGTDAFRATCEPALELRLMQDYKGDC
jgi:TetR/AcrR family transcriptional regulator, mexJK operon transcriptional repressor